METEADFTENQKKIGHILEILNLLVHFIRNSKKRF